MRPSNPFRYEYEQHGVHWRISNTDVQPIYNTLNVIQALQLDYPETIPLFIHNFEERRRQCNEEVEYWVRQYKYTNAGTQLNWAFTFSDTPEGHEFWCKIRNYFYENYR
jgi:hypothetical protein